MYRTLAPTLPSPLDERAHGVHLSYDPMTSVLSPYGNESALELARSLDRKVEHLLQEAAA